MKNSLFSLIVGLFFCTTLNAQSVAPSSNGDASRIVPAANMPLNTGLSIAPGSDIHASVYDSFNSYILEIYDRFGNTLDFHSYDGSNPDVAFDRDQKRVFVTYQLNGNIWLDTYDDQGTPNSYSLVSSQSIAPGKSPNIDINSYGYGTITWEHAQSVWACAITATPLAIYPATLVHTDAAQPDVAVIDYPYPINTPPSETWLTCVNYDGQLVIMDLSYPLLQNGQLASNQFQGFVWYFTPTTARYEHPRIASQHQKNYNSMGGHKNWTVVAQDCFGGGSAVKGVFFYYDFNNFNWVMTNPTDINPDFNQCISDPRPVVAYDRDEVHIAWSQRYFSSCAPQVNYNGLGEDVLMINYTHGGIALGADYFEINEQQSNFNQSRTSIATKYDGNFPVNNSSYIEGMFYHNSVEAFSKSVFATNPAYKTGATTTLSETSSLRLLTNPTSQAITVVTDGGQQYNFTLFDLLGKSHPINRVSSNGTQQTIDVRNLTDGLYILHYSSDQESGSLQVMVKN